MAVMIDIPGIGQVEAQNAASEATLKAILAAMSGGGRGGGGRGGAGGGGAGGKGDTNNAGARRTAPGNGTANRGGGGLTSSNTSGGGFKIYTFTLGTGLVTFS